MSFATTKKTNRDQTLDHLVVVDNLVLGQYCVFYNPGTTTVVDSGFSIVNQADPTKVLNFNNAGATTGTTETIALSQTANRVFTLPDITGTAIVNAGAQTLTGAKTFSAALTETAASNQLVFQPNGAGNTTTVNVVQPAGNRILTVYDPLQTPVNVALGVDQVQPTITTTASLTNAQSGTVIPFNSAGANYIISLPATAATSAGVKFTIVNSVTAGTNSVTIQTFGSENKFQGIVFGAATQVTCVNKHNIVFGATSQVGDYITCESDGINWFVRAWAQTAAALTVA